MIKYGILKWAGHITRMKYNRIALKILTAKPTGNKYLGKLRMDVKEIDVNMRYRMQSA